MPKFDRHGLDLKFGIQKSDFQPERTGAGKIKIWQIRALSFLRVRKIWTRELNGPLQSDFLRLLKPFSCYVTCTYLYEAHVFFIELSDGLTVQNSNDVRTNAFEEWV